MQKTAEAKKQKNTEIPAQITIAVQGDIFLYARSLNRDTMPAGVYQTVFTRTSEGYDYCFRPIEASNDRPLEIDDSVTKMVQEVRDFLGKRQAFKAMGFSHKRGYLLHGPPGCGKSSLLRLLEDEFVTKFDGLVLVWDPNGATGAGQFYEKIRTFEPDRPIMLVVEDIDASLHAFEEHLLEFLDGQVGLQNFVLVATTNNLDQIPSRIKDRPSRVDRLLEVGKPSLAARQKYLIQLGLGVPMVERIAQATDGFSVAQLKEVVIGHLLLGSPLDEVLNRLREADMTPTDGKADNVVDVEHDLD